MAMQAQLTAEILADNGDSKNISLSPFQVTSQAVSGFKSRVMAINNYANPATFDGGKLGINGGSYIKIKSATITTTDKTVIYARTEADRIRALEIGGDDNGSN